MRTLRTPTSTVRRPDVSEFIDRTPGSSRLFDSPTVIEPSHVLDGYVCSCGHAVRRHWNDGGCAVSMGGRGGLCPCSLTKYECQFHVVRRSLRTVEKISIRHVQHLRRFLVTPQFVPNDVRWVVRPWAESSVVVLFRSWVDAVEFATRDWLDPLGVNTARAELRSSSPKE